MINYLPKYSFKIIKLNKLILEKKKKLKNKKIVLCHGVFDLVHPGHVRHLAYAKSKADILVVSITSDRFIDKGVYRPHVPEQIRAKNLSAFEMIDYILIDDNKTPHTILKSLKPDYFAKGYEYSASNMPKKTLDEKKILDKFGGEFLFTPGDIVFSSTKFLENNLPNIDIEKLISVMESNKISFDDLKKIVLSFKGMNVHVLGDTIIDIFTRSMMIGGQTKTPTISVLKQRDDINIGGAAIVALHLASAGANVLFSSVVGDDTFGKYLIKNMKKKKVKLNIQIDKTRPTTCKNAIVANGYRLLKVDTLDNRIISKNLIENIVKKSNKFKNDILIFSDFRHGIFNQENINYFKKKLKKKSMICGDSQVASRWGNISEFKDFDLITPNEKEVRFSLADQDSTVGVLAGKLKKVSNFRNLILKLGDRGVFCLSKKSNKYISLGTFSDNIKDPVGAGDALLAYSSLTLKKTNSLAFASIIGSIAASCECEIDGNIPITPQNIIKKIDK